MYIYMYIYVYTYVYIYIYREREIYSITPMVETRATGTAHMWSAPDIQI